MNATGPAVRPRRGRERAAAYLITICVLAGLCAGCRSPAPFPSPSAATAAPNTPASLATAATAAGQTDEGDLPDAAVLELVLSGQTIHTIAVEDDAGKKVLMNAIFNHLIRSAARQGDDPDTIEDRITITAKFSPDEGYPTVYHVFDRDGKHCMQAGGGLYSAIGDEVYWPLHELAMGYALPQALTVRSGRNEIKATALPAEPGQNGNRFTPRQMAGHIQYLELDPDHREENLTPFTPYAGGRKVFGNYRLYDEQFEELQFIHPSGLEPQTYLFTEKAPGRYIVALETAVGDGDDAANHQYFFGVIVPTK